MDKKKLNAKDFINIGIFTVIYFVMHPRCGRCPGPAGRADPHRGQCAAPDRTGCGGHPRDAAAHAPAAFG